MPRDREQYWVSVEAASKEPIREEFKRLLAERLLKENGVDPYSPAMIDRIESNLVGNGFIDLTPDGRVSTPPHARKWDGSEETFRSYIGDTIRRWGDLDVAFHPGLVLAIDILTTLGVGPRAEADVVNSLLALDTTRGKYDPRDKHADRTVREFLKLLRFAGWVTQREGEYALTDDGRKARGKLVNRDVFHQAEFLLQKLGPDTGVFDEGDKTAIAKYYMYRQCGGKGKDAYFMERIGKAIYANPWSKVRRRHPQILAELREVDARRKDLVMEIQQFNPPIGKAVAYVRDTARLSLLRDALRRGDDKTAMDLAGQSGAAFSWDAVKRLRHQGPPYSIRSDLNPFSWQTRALAEWDASGRRGVLRVVTGAGKTVFALMALARVMEKGTDLRVTILVPTKVLMYQWAVELVRILGVPPEHIGLRGDGHKDSFADSKRVMVVIVNSATLGGYLRKDVASLPEQTVHFLVADECHRYRGEEFRHAFDCRIDWSLGLSATPVDPETERDSPETPSDVVIERCGPIFHNYSYKEALRDAIIQPFIVKYLGVNLTMQERAKYDAMTKKIGKALDRIRQRYGPRLDAMRAASFDQRLQVLLKTEEEPDKAIFDYFRLVRERKEMIFGAINRKRCYLELITKHAMDKCIVFHERIEDLEEIVAPLDRREMLLVSRGKSVDETTATYQDPDEKKVDKSMEEQFKKHTFRAVMYHSGHARQSWNRISMEWFRSGVANVMLSVKALVEGVDVPKANVGIIRTSSSSVRQRIQTTGRILRRAAGKDKPAILYVIYVRDTTDERIFRDVDWSEQVGSGVIESYHWIPPSDFQDTSGTWEDLHGELPKLTAPEKEPPFEVATEDLIVGDAYPGRYAGLELHVDAKGRAFRNTRFGRQFIENSEIREAAAIIRRLKGGGKFVVTPQGHIVTKVQGTGLLFLGVTGRLTYQGPKRAGKTSSSAAPTFDELVLSIRR